MIVYCIYKNPSDYPGKFVVRKWIGLKPGAKPESVTDTLEDARNSLPKYLILIGRQPDDDPAILETWL